MPHDAQGQEIHIGDLVTLTARVTNLYPTLDYCNMTIEGIDGDDDPRTKAACTINTRAVKLSVPDGQMRVAPSNDGRTLGERVST